MSLDLSFSNFIYIFSFSFGYVLGVVLLTYGVKNRSTNIIMGLSFLFLSHGILLAGLIDSGMLVNFPALFRTGNLAGLLYAFLPFLFIQYTLFDTKFKFWHFIHLVPALVYTIDFLPTFLMPTPEKIELILSQINDPYLVVSFKESRFFPANFYTEFRTMLINFYWFLSIGLVWNYRRKPSNAGKKREVLMWIQTYLFFQIILFVPYYLVYKSLDRDLLFKSVHLAAALLNLSTGIFLLYFPKILYGYNFKSSADPLTPSVDSATEKQDLIDSTKAEELAKLLETQLKHEKVFLSKGYSINDLAKDSGIPHYLLSQYINQNLGISFPEYINRERIKYCCELIETDSVQNYTLEAIGEMCGFSNRNSFSAAFKKVMGESPSAYIRNRGK